MRAVLFDYGDTLLDFRRRRRAVRAAYLEVARVIAAHSDGRAPDPETLARTVPREVAVAVHRSYLAGRLDEVDIVEVFDGVLRRWGVVLPAAALRQVVELDHDAVSASLHLPEETRDLLDALRRAGLRTAVVSNAAFLPHRMLADLRRLGLAALLDAAVFSSAVGRRKPDPTPFWVALRRLGVRPEDAIMVGDRVREDVRGAEAAGLAGAVLTRQYRWEAPSGRELAVIDRLQRLEELLRR